MIGGEKRARNKTSGKVVIDGKKNERERKYSRHPPIFVTLRPFFLL